MSICCLTALLAPLAVPQDLAERVAATARPAEMKRAGLSGAGADFLVDEGRASEFFLIGESHGNVETCRLTRWLMGELEGSGYGTLALETGPVTTEHLVDLAARKGRDAVFDFVRSNPFVVAFLFWSEEVDLFVDAVESEWTVWGLDQEFAGSARFLLRLMAEGAESDEARALASEMQARAEAGFAHFAQTGDQSKSFLSAATPEDFQRLETAFAEESEELRRVLAELRATAEVYGHFNQGRFFLNNRDRIDLMKRHFADRLRADGSEPRVLMKFGSVHMSRGYSAMAQLDVGNFAAEAAVLRGGRSFHLNVFARRSVALDGSVQDFEASSPHLRPFFDALEGTATVFDLRELRPFLSSDSAKRTHPELHDLAFRFDALLLVSEFNASEPLFPLPQGR